MTPAEAEGGYNGFGGSADNFSAPTGFVSPILDHADYRITLSSDTMNFSVSGNTITVSAVPVPAAVWLFGSALAGFGVFGRKKNGLTA